MIIIYKNWFHWRSIYSKLKFTRIERSRLSYPKTNKSLVSNRWRVHFFKKSITKEWRLHKIHKMVRRNNKISSSIWNNKRDRTILIQLIYLIRNHLILNWVNRLGRANYFNNFKYWHQVWTRQICLHCQLY